MNTCRERDSALLISVSSRSVFVAVVLIVAGLFLGAQFTPTHDSTDDAGLFDQSADIEDGDLGSRTPLETLRPERSSPERALFEFLCEAQPDSVAAEQACEALIAVSPEPDVCAEQMATRYEGTRVEWVARLYLLRFFMDPVDEEALEVQMLKLLERDAPGDALSRRSMFYAVLDALGRPYTVQYLVDSEESAADWWAQLQSFSRSLDKPTDHARPILDARESLDAMFAADFSCLPTLTMRHARHLFWRISDLPGDLTEPEIDEVVNILDDFVSGVCRRSASTQSLFHTKQSLGTMISARLLMTEWLTFLRELLTDNLELRERVAPSIGNWAETMKTAGLLADAEGLFLLAIHHSHSPAERNTLVLTLSSLYEQSWQAYDSSRQVLKQVLEKDGPSEPLLLALARVTYLQGDFQATVDLVSPYIAPHVEFSKNGKLLFVLGAALDQLGRSEEAKTVWEDARPLLNDRELREVINRKLSHEAQKDNH